MAKINKDCERRHLRGCSGCTILHSICSQEIKNKNKKLSLEMAQEEENQFLNKFYKENEYVC
ncbi:MAG: hypothetical protein PHF86_08405 [Candidatus Nanoarchaeia archaeon]|jgi:flavoprotein|nr:hypothetical protein [Candidatus Nanoarchaeia archaeon]